MTDSNDPVFTDMPSGIGPRQDLYPDMEARRGGPTPPASEAVDAVVLARLEEALQALDWPYSGKNAASILAVTLPGYGLRLIRAEVMWLADGAPSHGERPMTDSKREWDHNHDWPSQATPTPAEWGAVTPPASEAVDAAWVEMRDEMPADFMVDRAISRHRDRIEAAIRASQVGLDEVVIKAETVAEIERQVRAEGLDVLCDATQSTETWGVMWCGLFRGHPTEGGHHWFSDRTTANPRLTEAERPIADPIGVHPFIGVGVCSREYPGGFATVCGRWPDDPIHDTTKIAE